MPDWFYVIEKEQFFVYAKEDIRSRLYVDAWRRGCASFPCNL